MNKIIHRSRCGCGWVSRPTLRIEKAQSLIHRHFDEHDEADLPVGGITE